MRLQTVTVNAITTKKSQFSNVATTLNAISPLQTLERGYSITLDSKGNTIQSSTQLEINDNIETRLRNGRIISRVEKCINDGD